MRASDLIIDLVILGIILPSVIGFMMGRPVFVSYAYSDSMTPTINRWDVFFINPLSKGDVGDIIVFNLSGKWTVHRVYAITESGYITKGDNNVATDQQDNKNPPIPRNQVIGKVITLGGRPIKIPKLGKYLQSKDSHYLAIGLVALGGVMLGSNEKRRRKRRGKVIDTGTIYIALSALLAFGVVFTGSIAWGEISIPYTSTLAGGQREGWYLPGSVVERNVTVENYAKFPMVMVVEGEDIRRVFKLEGGEERKIEITIDVPEETRVYNKVIKVYPYYPILPLKLIDWANSKSPYLPLLMEGLMVFLGLLALKPLLGEPEYINLGRFWS
ncbi:signal peptidase I [Pyrococcus abyssi]|uniref:Signal peptidase related n=1 Tax=Pyrococcus abyssi (strain GE5 / Orsay) TaxID=272844 RepID=Q9UYM5_PYRAB|nr:signal peptidase I [Pyrococcus abyssi]CAB50387.1 Signal peptidase related protein, putative [Pyrococcus abyssi GE5]CCE70934.1 TPA: signal peptidase related [Pyrococcus abyssi GE5]